jgi:cytochrome oxidase Cu insertion factor (SCO1/SenC/PrrC family)
MRSKFFIAGLMAVALAGAAAAQQFGLPAASVPAMVQGVGIDQNLNAQIPLELAFKDETGQTVRLGQYFRGKPVVLALVYYECPGLCDLILNGLTHVMGETSLNVGTDYDVVTVSFNPKETWQLADAKKANYIEKYNRPGTKEGWHFLTGQPDAIKSLTETVGFHQQAVRPRQRHHDPDAGRQDRALLLRNRIQAARFPPGPGGGIGQ